MVIKQSEKTMDTPAAKNEYHLNKKGFLLQFAQTAVKNYITPV